MGEYAEYQAAQKQAMEQTLELLSKGLLRESKEELDCIGIFIFRHGFTLMNTDNFYTLIKTNP